MGPYHFTAVWYNKTDEKNYRIHQFLNESNQLAIDPTWDLISNEDFIKNDPPDCFDDINQVVWDLAFPALQAIQKANEQSIQQLIKDYNKLEHLSCGLSEEYSDQNNKLIEHTNDIIKILEKLTSISNNYQWGRLHKYYSSNIESLKSQNLKHLDINHINEESKTSKTDNKCIDSSEQSPSIEEKEENKKYNQLAKQYEALKYICDRKQEAILLKTIYENILLDQFNTLPFFLQKQLTEIIRYVEAKGGKLLKNALIKEDFETVETLHTFYPLIKDIIVAFTLSCDNDMLLQFLYERFNLPINNQFILNDEDKLISMTEYCYRNNKENCLTILIKHGVDLMESIEPEGLPMAHLIFVNDSEKNSLYQALEKNSEKTIANITFYRRLIVSLENHLNNKKPNEDELKKIENAIKLYKIKLEQTKLSTNGYQNLIRLLTPFKGFNHKTEKVISTVNQLTDFHNIAKKIIGNEDLIKKVQEDSDIKNKNKEIIKWAKKEAETIKRARREGIKVSTNYPKLLEERNKRLAQMSSSKLSFEELKKDAQTYQNHLIKIAQETIKYLENAMILKKTPMNLKRQNLIKKEMGDALEKRKESLLAIGFSEDLVNKNNGISSSNKESTDTNIIEVKVKNKKSETSNKKKTSSSSSFFQGMPTEDKQIENNKDNTYKKNHL